MSVPGELLYHPINGSTEKTWTGFSWPGFLFGTLWLVAKQLWMHFVINILILILTAGFGAIILWIFYGIAGNSIYTKSLLRKGYLTGQQYAERRRTDSTLQSSSSNVDRTVRPINTVADQIEQLARLKNAGALTEDEFNDQKRKLLRF